MVHTHATSQTPARAPHEIAEAEGAGLIVVGSTPRGLLGRIAAGRITERTVHGRALPRRRRATGVRGARARPPSDRGRVADTPEGHEALRAGAALARHVGARLQVVTVLGILAWGPPIAQPTAVDGRFLDEQREQAVARVQAALAELGDVDATVEVLVDSTHEGLLRASEALDLLVCGSRSYGRLRTVLLGGVSQALAREARCPVIVVPRGAERALEELLPADREADRLAARAIAE